LLNGWQKYLKSLEFKNLKFKNLKKLLFDDFNTFPNLLYLVGF